MKHAASTIQLTSNASLWNVVLLHGHIKLNSSDGRDSEHSGKVVNGDEHRFI